MPILTGKRIILGITGGIAAYKSAELVRLLRQQQAEVKVVMTAGAKEFITPLTLQALSGQAVHQDLLDPKAEAAMGHIQLARWADLILVAPASANFVAKLNAGQGNDLLNTLCLASAAKIVLAPAMNQQMWANAATQNNISSLQTRGITVLGPAQGEQACGDVGPGRMLEPAQIICALENLFQGQALSGKKVVITAGPTREAIDPIRYISNHSSGKMGFAIAQAAAEAGAITTIIVGPVHLNTPERVARIDVISAKEMYQAALEVGQDADIFIATAAVADYRPQTCASEKVKKTTDILTLTLEKNPDIIAAIAKLDPKPFTVGFAAETQNLIAYARSKIEQKNLDMIAANDVSNKDIGFNSEENALTVIWPEGHQELKQASKSQIAQQLLALIIQQYSLTQRGAN